MEGEELAIHNKLVTREFTAIKEPSITRVAQAAAKLVASTRDAADAPIDRAAEDLIAEADAFELTMATAASVLQACDMELAHYEDIRREIEAATVASGDSIGGLRSELDRERLVKRRRLEYEALAKVVNQQPPQSQMRSERDGLNAELAALNARSAKVAARLNLRNKQFQLLLRSVHDLRQALAEDGTEDTPASPSHVEHRNG